MTMSKMDRENLLSGRAATARDWFERTVRDAAAWPADFNWHGFAEGAALRARSCGDPVREADSWAEIALAVYGRLATEATDEFTRHTFELAAMNLRAWLISRFGAVAAHPVRDWSLLVNWFLRSTTITFEDAERGTRALRA